MHFINYGALISLFVLLQCKQAPVNKEITTLRASLSAFAEGNGEGHPMDALSQEEIIQAKQLLSEAGKVDSLTRFSIIHLKEAPKKEILVWKAGDPINRKAFAIIKRGKKVFEAVVDLTGKEVLSWEEKKDVQPAYLFEEYAFAAEACREHPDFQAAMRKRGYESFEKIDPQPLSPGYFNIPEEEGLRLFKMSFMDLEGIVNHQFGRPIEGVYATVDLDNKKVLEIIDTGIIPVSESNHAYDEASVGGDRARLNPVELKAPKGNIKQTGSQFEWDMWKFHFRIDHRVGPIISLASFDGRSVLYQLSVNEMFVPYMDPSIGWYYRSYMDIGEYGFGIMGTPLELGRDCPDYATLLSGIFSGDLGDPFPMENIAAVFERNTGKPLWRHAEVLNGTHESRASIELVVRMIPTIGNYDYLVDYIFTQNGEIKVEVGATGIDAVKGVKTQHMSDLTAEEDTRYGELVAENLVAVYHDHFLSFRVDVDIDGQQNTFVKDHLVGRKFEDDTRRLSGWRVEPEAITQEGGIDMGHNAYWRIVNPNKTNALGNPVSYHLRPGMTHLSLLDPEDYPQRRAAFSAKPLWLTAHDDNEFYPAGTYPNASKGGEGIPQFISDEEGIENEDLVLWYTLGFHHLTIAEDWPVLPTMYHSFTLRPFNFFDRNPALDVKQEFEE